MKMKPEEELAIRFVEKWLGGRGDVRGLGNGNSPDFEINYLDGSFGLGEIKADEDEDTKSQWSVITKRAGTQLIELPQGLGSWSIRIHKTARIDVLIENLSRIIKYVTKNNLSEWVPEYVYPKSEENNFLLSIGILEILRSQIDNRDVVWIQPDGFGGAVPHDANMTIAWIEEMFAVERWAKSWERIKTSEARESHAFFWIGTKSPENLRLRVSFHPDKPPTEIPKLPTGFTHVWVGVGSSFGQHYSAWVFERGLGWQVVTVPL